MNKFQMKSLIKEAESKIIVLPRRSHYLVILKSQSGKQHVYSTFFTKKPLLFDNLNQVNIFLKKLNINSYELSQNCPHTEMITSDDNSPLNTIRNHQEYIQVRI